MKSISAALLIAAIGLMGLQGCSDTTAVKHETKTTTPGGTTTTTVEKEIKKTGDNPPPAQ